MGRRRPHQLQDLAEHAERLVAAVQHVQQADGRELREGAGRGAGRRPEREPRGFLVAADRAAGRELADLGNWTTAEWERAEEWRANTGKTLPVLPEEVWHIIFWMVATVFDHEARLGHPVLLDGAFGDEYEDGYGPDDDDDEYLEGVVGTKVTIGGAIEDSNPKKKKQRIQ